MPGMQRHGLWLVALFLSCLLAAPAWAQFGQGGSVEFTNGQAARDIPFELNSDKIYLEVRVNGEGPFWLVLDTGSPGMILDTAVGAALGIDTGEGFEVGGAGENAFVLAPARETLEVTLPGLRLSGQRAHVGGIDAVVGPFEGRRIDGVLGGFNIFATHIVEVDYAAGTISVYPREGWAPEDGGAPVDVHIEGGHCVLPATAVLEGGDTLSGHFMLDTGLRGNLVFSTPYVNANELLGRAGDTIYTTMGGGVGGQVKAHIARIRDFDFGGHRTGSIYVSLSQLSRGALASPDNAGIIGAAVLQRFRVVFDYAGERIFLHAREYDADRLDFDKSGMFLVSDVDDRSVCRVIDLIPGSPADEAGLRVGDIVRSVEGAGALAPGLEGIRRRFRSPEGTTIEIEYEREGRHGAVQLTLRRLI